jgi:hypothetical protein
MTTRPDLTEGDRALAGATARLLAACAAAAGALGLGCAAVAAAALLLHAPFASAPWLAAVLVAVLGAAPVERVLALRLRFDAGLFADLAGTRSPQPLPLAALDQALQTLRLRQAAPATRPLAERARGAQRLVVWHASCAALQFTGLLVVSAGAAFTAMGVST